MRKTQVMAAAGLSALALAACGGPRVVNGVNGNAAGPIVPAPATSFTPAALPQGPFRIRILHCGKFSAAQQAVGGWQSGLIFTYTNVTQAEGPAAPNLTINYTVNHGRTVVGYNVNAYVPLVSYGQTATGQVGGPATDNGTSQVDLAFTGCDPVSYTVSPEGDGPYAP